MDFLPIKRDFAGGPQNKKMTMPDNMSSQLVSMDKVQNQGRLDEKWSTGPGQRFLLTKIVLPQDLGLVSAQDKLVKRHIHFLTRVTFWLFKKLPLKYENVKIVKIQKYFPKQSD